MNIPERVSPADLRAAAEKATQQALKLEEEAQSWRRMAERLTEKADNRDYK